MHTVCTPFNRSKALCGFDQVSCTIMHKQMDSILRNMEIAAHFVDGIRNYYIIHLFREHEIEVKRKDPYRF